MGLCFQDLTSIESFPSYSGRSKLVTDFASLVDGTHDRSDDFYNIVMGYGGPQYKGAHPPEWATQSQRQAHWQTHIESKGGLDSAALGIPLRAWAKDADSLIAVKTVAQTYFKAYPDISLVMYYYDVYASALIYAVVDILGLIADISYDIFEFFVILLLEVYQTLIHVLVEGLMWIINNAGDTISAIWCVPLALLRPSCSVAIIRVFEYGTSINKSQFQTY
jgi:hypothetical protein